MIGLLIQDNAYEQDIRELLMSFYPGETYAHEVKEGVDFYVQTRLEDGEAVIGIWEKLENGEELEGWTLTAHSTGKADLSDHSATKNAIKNGDKSITEITCHARGAHFLNPEVRTVIDIGGQDSKVIRLDENGAVANFVMNDKCAAGTGRFLEMMARTMEMNLDQMSECGLEFKEDITISSMCTVFAESEVVSLIAQNKATDDIVHGLNKAVAVKTAALTRRVGGEEKYMMTGGVSKNKGLVKTLEEKLGTKLVISDKAQLCGALGAALFAADMADA